MSCEGRAFQSAVAPSNSPMAHLVVLLVDARNEKEGSVALVHDLLVSPLDEIAHLRRTPQHHRRDLADDPDLVPRAVGLVPLRAGTRKHTNRHARRRDGDRSARARARALARGGGCVGVLAALQESLARLGQSCLALSAHKEQKVDLRGRSRSSGAMPKRGRTYHRDGRRYPLKPGSRASAPRGGFDPGQRHGLTGHTSVGRCAREARLVFARLGRGCRRPRASSTSSRPAA